MNTNMNTKRAHRLETAAGAALLNKFCTRACAAALALGLTQMPVPAEATVPATIRVLTWNTWMIPDLAAPGHAGNLDNDRRLVNMAARINTGAYDVVMLNEVFNGALEEAPYEDAIYLLTGKLGDDVDKTWLDEQYAHLQPNPGDEPIKPKGQYLYYAYVPGFWTDTIGNSGLQAFTNFPPLPRTNMPFLSGLNAWDSSGYNFFCFGQGEEEYRKKQIELAASPLGPSPWVMAPAFVTFGASQCAGAFSWFTDAADDDAGAIKGVGWLRVLNTKTQQPLNIFFTHAQADYPEKGVEYAAVRALQMQQIRDFIQLTAPAGEDVVFGGDFNIFGDGNWLPPGSPVPLNTAQEYQDQIVGHFGAVGFEDSFRQHLKAGDKDWGYTRDRSKNPNNAADPFPQRLDYILARWSLAPWFDYYKCIQHVRVRRDFDIYKPYSQADMDASDHYPVEMTVGFEHGYCSPRSSFDFATVPATESSKALTLDFAQPGAMQWLRVPAFTDLLATADKGVSWIGGSPSNVRFEAFKATDISMPLKAFGGKPEQGDGGLRDLKNGLVLSFPFDIYVRVQPVDKNFVGSTKIMLTRLDGKNFDLAIPVGMTGFLASNEKGSGAYDTTWSNDWSRPVTLAGTNIPGQIGQQEMWFRYNVDVLQPSLQHCVTINLLQNHEYQQNNPNGFLQRSYAYALYDAVGNQVQALGPPIPMPGYSSSKPWQINISCTHTAKLEYASKKDDQRLRLKRGLQSNAAEKLRVNITTDVRGARFLSLHNITTNDPGPPSGDDEPAGILTLDWHPIRMKAWGIEEGGGMVNWNHVVDWFPQGATQHHAQFKQHWQWEIGESSMSADSSWDAGSVEWYKKWTNDGILWFEFSDIGVRNLAIVNGFQDLHKFSRFQYESGTRTWAYTKKSSAPTGRLHVLIKAYMPGGIDMESEE